MKKYYKFKPNLIGYLEDLIKQQDTFCKKKNKKEPCFSDMPTESSST